MIKNFDPNWMYVELTPNFFNIQMYQTMERFSGVSFHLYIVDFDKDGYVDIVLPNFLNNTLVYLRNPGSAYWRKISDLKAMEKWPQVPVVQSAYSDTIKDFVLINIDSEDKLVVVVLSQYSIGKPLVS
jgi:hypothetical protein